MVKNIGNAILLFSFFVIVILILQITSHQRKTIEYTTELPKSTTILIRCHQNSFIKKFLLSILYTQNENISLKQFYKQLKNPETQNLDESLEAFLLNLDIKNPLEVLSVKKKDKNLVFIRQRNTEQQSQKHLFSTNNYLYLQLNHLDENRDGIQALLNDRQKVKIPKSPTRDVAFYRLNNQKLILDGNINTNNDGISISLPKRKTDLTRNELKPDGLHVSISNHDKLLPLLKDEKTKNNITSLSVNYYGLNTYDSPLFFPDADFLFEFENEMTTDHFINYFSTEFFNKSNIIYTADSSNQESGKLNIDDIVFKYKKIQSNNIYIGSMERAIHIEKTQKPLEISGDLSVIFNFSGNGWKGRLAKEIITSIPVLNQLNTMLKNIEPVSTSDHDEGSKIDITFKKKESAYIELMNLLTAGTQ